MLLGYDKEGNIKFIFTDEKYLEMKYPGNTAKISNFWKNIKHGLTELFIPIDVFRDWSNYKNYKIVKGMIVKKNKEEIKNKTQHSSIKKMKSGGAINNIINSIPKEPQGEYHGKWETCYPEK